MTAVRTVWTQEVSVDSVDPGGVGALSSGAVSSAAVSPASVLLGDRVVELSDGDAAAGVDMATSEGAIRKRTVALDCCHPAAAVSRTIIRFCYHRVVPKVSDEHRERMRQRIQDAALACVGRTGFAAVSMADIIAEAGLSAGAVYLYYRSKEQLISDIARRVLDPRLAELERVEHADPLSPPDEVIPGLMKSLSATEFFPRLAVQVWGDVVHHDRELAAFARTIVDRVTRQVAAYLAAWLTSSRGLDADDAAARGARLAPAVVGLIQGYAIQSALLGEEAGAAYIDATRALLAAG